MYKGPIVIAVVWRRIRAAVAGCSASVSVVLLAAGALAGCVTMPSQQVSLCLAGTAYVAYYYKYNEAAPDKSEIVYIELVPPSGASGDRCIKVSKKQAPLFPDKNTEVKIAEMGGRVVDIKGAADIAVYYDANAKDGAPMTPARLAVEDLSGVSRLIQTLSVTAESPSCGNCPSVKCDGYVCCKPLPCP